MKECHNEDLQVFHASKDMRREQLLIGCADNYSRRKSYITVFSSRRVKATVSTFRQNIHLTFLFPPLRKLSFLIGSLDSGSAGGAALFASFTLRPLALKAAFAFCQREVWSDLRARCSTAHLLGFNITSTRVLSRRNILELIFFPPSGRI